MNPYAQHGFKGQFDPLRAARDEPLLLRRSTVCVTSLAGLSVFLASAASGDLRVEVHVAYDPVSSTMGGRLVTLAPSRGERRERSLRPRSCRWFLEEFFAGRFTAATHMGLGSEES